MDGLSFSVTGHGRNGLERTGYASVVVHTVVTVVDELRRFLVIILGLTIPLLAGLLIRLDAPRAQIDAWTPGMLEPADGAV